MILCGLKIKTFPLFKTKMEKRREKKEEKRKRKKKKPEMRKKMKTAKTKQKLKVSCWQLYEEARHHPVGFEPATLKTSPQTLSILFE